MEQIKNITHSPKLSSGEIKHLKPKNPYQMYFRILIKIMKCIRNMTNNAALDV